MTEEAVVNDGGFKPPWMAFQTFWSFTQELSEHDLPPVIDRSLMNSKSGTDQANILGALKAFGLIDADNRVQPVLAEIATSDAEIRKLALEELIKKFFAAPLEVSAKNGTHAQLIECFRDTYGVTGADTLRKATTFFLQACRTAGISVSPHFKATRTSAGGSAKPRKSRKVKVISDDEKQQVSSPPNVDEHRVSVALSTGGTMTLSVSVNPLSLRGDDRNFFYDIVDKLTDYQEKSAAPKSPRTSETEEGE